MKDNTAEIVVYCTPKFKKDWLAFVKKTAQQNKLQWVNSGSYFAREALLAFMQENETKS